MSQTPIEKIVGRQDGAGAGAKPETGAAAVSNETTAAAVGATPADGQSTQPTDDPIHGLKSALGKERERGDRFEKETKAEKRARTQLEEQVKALTRQLAEIQSPKEDPKVRADKFFGNAPEYVDGRVTEVAERAAQAIANKAERMSRALAKRQYQDFDEVESHFIEAARKDQSLWEGVVDDDLPAYVVYERGKRLMEAAGSATSAADRVAKLEAEIAELKNARRDGGQTSAAAETAAAPAKPSIPRSNVGARSGGVGRTSSFAGPTPAEKVWGRQRAG